MTTAGAAVLLALVIATGAHPRKLVQDATPKVATEQVNKKEAGDERRHR